MSPATEGDWRSTACVLCSLNCGLLVRVEDNRITKVRGDKSNPFSRGYTCSKGLTVAKYAHHDQRVREPLKRQPDGTHVPISWDQAISEIAEKLNQIIARSGGRTVGLVGGGGQANHMDFVYALGLLQMIGSTSHFNALAQEFTQKYWVNGHVFGSEGSDFDANPEESEFYIVIGSNPWLSHGIQRARVVLKEIAKDPDRSMVVVDPRRTETAKMADKHLQIRPGTDLFLLLAMLNVIVREDLVDEAFTAEHSHGWENARFIADLVTPARAAELCDLEEDDIVDLARRFATAESASIKFDLGIYHNRYSLENCFLQPLLHIITGNMCTARGSHFPLTLFSGANLFADGEVPRTQVAGIPAIRGLFPPNALPEEILEAGDQSIRALFVEGCNPLRSYADTQAMTRAFEALELLVVIEPAMTEAAMLAHYVLPVPVGYEKWEASVFPKGFPEIHAHLRAPVIQGPPEAKQECLIFYEIAKAMGLDLSLHPLYKMMAAAVETGEVSPVLSFVKLVCTVFAAQNRDKLIEAGTLTAEDDPAEALFKKLLENPQGLLLCRADPEDNWSQVSHPDKKAVLDTPEVLALFRDLEIPDDTDFRKNSEFPFILQTGERTDSNANTIHRDPSWRKALHTSYLRMNSSDAQELAVEDGERVRLVTEYAEVTVPAMLSEDIYRGNLSMPHGYGLLSRDPETGKMEPVGVNVQELIRASHREPLSGIPFHKAIPARVEKL
ncbi:MAG: molybdopterin-dependent oxidoreductase [bacterium]|nr:molybdopterin-dependent oxidoreductase [bacterium]